MLHTIVQQDSPRARPNNGQRNWAAPGGTAAKRYGGESVLSREQIRRIANTVFEARNRMPRFKSPGAIYVRTMKNAMKELRAEDINTVKQSFEKKAASLMKSYKPKNDEADVKQFLKLAKVTVEGRETFLLPVVVWWNVVRKTLVSMGT